MVIDCAQELMLDSMFHKHHFAWIKANFPNDIVVGAIAFHDSLSSNIKFGRPFGFRFPFVRTLPFSCFHLER
jgi:hypothetical protein